MFENKPLEVELIQDVPVFCKILCMGKQMPARLKFEYKTRGELNLYASTKNREPDFGDCEMKVQGRPLRMLFNATRT